MKTKALKILYLGLILLVPLFGGCQEEGSPLESGDLVSLTKIPENPDYASLPLVGTRWKLIGFVDSKLEMIKLAEPDSDSNYILVFSEDGKLQGQTSTNTANGRYSLSNNSLLISNFTNSTEINELFDGLSYIKAMKMVNSFDITSKGLKLIYDQDKYLLFKPASINDLCSLQSELDNTENECLGEFLFHIKNVSGKMKFSETLGYYVQIQTQGTYDCSILGIVCDDKDVRELEGSTLSFSADFHNYGLNYSPPIGGQKVFSLNNLTFK